MTNRPRKHLGGKNQNKFSVPVKLNTIYIAEFYMARPVIMHSATNAWMRVAYLGSDIVHS